jgi:hypothetical protein
MSQIVEGTVVSYDAVTADVVCLIPELYGDQQVTVNPMKQKVGLTYPATALTAGDTVMIYIGTSQRTAPRWFMPDSSWSLGNGKVDRVGDTMTGRLTMQDTGITIRGDFSLEYRDTTGATRRATIVSLFDRLTIHADGTLPILFEAGAAERLRIGGDGVITVAPSTKLVLAADPTLALEAVTKQYSDLKFAKAGGTITGATTIDVSATAGAVPLRLFADGNNGSLRIRNENESPYIEWFNSTESTRFGFIQGLASTVNASTALIIGAETGRALSLRAAGAAEVTFFTNGVEQASIDSSGRLIMSGDTTTEKIRLEGTTAAQTPYISFFSSTGGTRYGYVQGTAANLNIVSDAGDVLINSGGGQVRTSDGIYTTGQSRLFYATTTSLLVGSTGMALIGFYPSATNVDTFGTIGGQVGMMTSTVMSLSADKVGSSLQISSDTTILFIPGNVVSARFDASGNFLHGKSVSNTWATTGGIEMWQADGQFFITNATATFNAITHISAADANGASYLRFYRTGTNIMGNISQVSTTGVTYGATSHGPFKGNIQDLDDDAALERLRAWRPVSYQWRLNAQGDFDERAEPTGPVEHGFIAQELYAIQPSAVAVGYGTEEAHRKWKAAGSEGASPFLPWMVDPAKLMADVVAATQAIDRRVQVLEDARG